MPVDYIPRTRELYSGYTPYRWVVNEHRRRGRRCRSRSPSRRSR